jgi:hypothetical protein
MKIIVRLSRKKAMKFARHLKQEHPKYSRTLKIRK